MREEQAAVESAWSRLPSGAREQLEHGMRTSELRTLLMAVAEQRAGRLSPHEVMRQWREDRLVRPASADPRLLAQLEARFWSVLPDEFEGVELSPVAPLGTCSAVAGVSQNRVVSTTRLVEVVSDSTSALAVELAGRRHGVGTHEAVHLAACQRQLRAQVFGPDAGSHFRLLCLASGTRDTGSATAHAALLSQHLLAWREVCALLPAELAVTVELAAWHPVLAERVDDTVLSVLEPDDRFRVVLTPERTRARGYYGAGALLITARAPAGEPVELGDGGFTDWTARLTSNAKELCLVSCLATERALELAREADA
jgi:hypothetical protein